MSITKLCDYCVKPAVYNAATERLNKAKAQVDIFEAADMPKPEQLTI